MRAWQVIQQALADGRPLDVEERRGVACCARLIADLDEFGLLPQGVTRLDALEVAIEFASTVGTFDPIEHAILETDYIESLFQAGRFDEAFQRVDWAREDHAEVHGAVADMLLLSANAHEYLGEYAAAIEKAAIAQEVMAEAPNSDPERGTRRIFAACVHAKILIHLGVLDEAARILEAAKSQASSSDLLSCQSILLTAGTELANAREDQEWVVEHVGKALQGGQIHGDSPSDRLGRELDLAQAKALIAHEAGHDDTTSTGALESAIARLGLEDSKTWNPALTLCDLEILDGRSQSAARRLEALESILGEDRAQSPLNVRSALAGVRGRLALLAPEAEDALIDARDAAELALMELLDAWRSIPHRKGGIGFLQFDERRSLLATLSRLDAAVLGPERGAEHALKRLLEVEALGSLADSLSIAEADLEQVRNELVPERGGLIVFLPSSTGSTAITLDGTGARTWTLPGSDSWSNACLRLGVSMQVRAAANENADLRVESLAAWVRDALIPAELDAKFSTWNEVVLVRTDNLGWVPFEVLPLAGRGGRPLGLELGTSYLPSLRLGLALVARHRGALEDISSTRDGRILVLVSTARGASSLAEIPWSESDGRQMTARWPASSVTVDVDSEDALRTLSASGRRAGDQLILVSHGVRDGDRERSQGFLLGEDQRVFPADLESLQVPPLCVLLVCGANAGRIRRGEDLGSHLVSAFIVGGADTVASARTDLSFEASVALVAAFNEGIAAGLAPSQSLRDARRRVAGTERWRHPAFHSNLTLTGLGWIPSRAPTAASPDQRR